MPIDFLNANELIDVLSYLVHPAIGALGLKFCARKTEKCLASFSFVGAG